MRVISDFLYSQSACNLHGRARHDALKAVRLVMERPAGVTHPSAATNPNPSREPAKVPQLRYHYDSSRRIIHHFLAHSSARHHPCMHAHTPNSVICSIPSTHVYRVLIGACNPIVTCMLGTPHVCILGTPPIRRLMLSDRLRSGRTRTPTGRPSTAG